MADEVALMGPGGGRMLKEDNTLVNMADKAEESLGGKGVVIITDGAEHTPAAGLCFCALHMMSDSVIAAYVVDASAPVTGTLTGVTFSAGTWLFGKFTSVTLTSGSLLAYNGAL